MKIDIIVVHMNRYPRGDEAHFVPPITGIHLAALTPPEHDVRVIHQHCQRIEFDTDADLIALSFFSGFADEAYRLAREFKRRGKTVVMGGPHATFLPDEALKHCDAVVVGEAESVWAELLSDAAHGKLRRIYTGTTGSLAGLPAPRCDLLPDNFIIKKVVQATRGCTFSCSFCSVPAIHPGFRMRPVDEVVRDASYDRFKHWWQRKMVWFWDDNLTANRPYVKDLLRAMIPLKKWWLTQASIDIGKDGELLDLMKQSGCIGVFLGIESLSPTALKSAHKLQNKVDYYRERIAQIHKRGICVMAGFMSGFDDDTPETIEQMADRLYDIGVDVPFLSILTPFKGTALYDQMEAEGRLIEDRGWEFYNGYNVVFRPANMTADEMLAAHRKLWNRAFSPWHSFKRTVRGLRTLRPGALLLCATMNTFYGLKRLRSNGPQVMKVGMADTRETDGRTDAVRLTGKIAPENG